MSDEHTHVVATLRLRRATACVAIGPSVARRQDVVEAIHKATSLPIIAMDAGGTISYLDPSWLRMELEMDTPSGSPIDDVLSVLMNLANKVVAPTHFTTGTIEHSWCPGFSDLGVGGKKLIGSGIHLRGTHVILRASFPVTPLTPSTFTLLDTLHRALGRDVRPDCVTSLSELLGHPVEWEDAAAAFNQAASTSMTVTIDSQPQALIATYTPPPH